MYIYTHTHKEFPDNFEISYKLFSGGLSIVKADLMVTGGYRSFKQVWNHWSVRQNDDRMSVKALCQCQSIENISGYCVVMYISS